jgi:hypothetical protein
MSILVYCDECGQNAQVRDEMAGRSIRCRACGSSISVPGLDDVDDDDDDDDGRDDYRVQPQRRSKWERPVRDERDGGGISLANWIITACVAIGVFALLCVATAMVRGVKNRELRDEQAAAPQQPNQFPRPNVNAPGQNAAPANFPPPRSFPTPNVPPTVPPTTPPAFPPTVPPTFPPGFPPTGHGAPGIRPPMPPRFPPGPRGMRRTTPTALRPPARTGTTTTMYGGSGGSPFQMVVPEGPLLGLRFRPGSWGGEAAIGQVELIHDRTSARGGDNEAVAREGFAVGGLEVNAATYVNGIRIIFMAIDKDGKLDPTNTYTSKWLGKPAEKNTQTINPGGALVIGIHGRRAAVLDSIGLVVE